MGGVPARRFGDLLALLHARTPQLPHIWVPAGAGYERGHRARLRPVAA